MTDHAGGFIALLALIVSVIALRPNRKTNPYIDMLETRAEWTKAIIRLKSNDDTAYSHKIAQLNTWADGF